MESAWFNPKEAVVGAPADVERGGHENGRAVEGTHKAGNRGETAKTNLLKKSFSSKLKLLPSTTATTFSFFRLRPNFDPKLTDTR